MKVPTVKNKVPLRLQAEYGRVFWHDHNLNGCFIQAILRAVAKARNVGSEYILKLDLWREIIGRTPAGCCQVYFYLFQI